MGYSAAPSYRSSPGMSSRMSSPRSVPVATSQTYKSPPSYATRPTPSARTAQPQRSAPAASATTQQMSRTPLSRVDPQSGGQFTPRKAAPGGSTPYGSNSVGNRQWPGTGGSQGGNYQGNRGYPDQNHYGNHPSQLPSYGRYPNYANRYPYHGHDYHNRYPYYGTYGWYRPYYGYYGCDRPYYYAPYYAYGYPYLWPTFSFGLSYWDTPSYYAEPTVVYTQPSTVVYTEPAQTYYADPGTAYVDTQPVSPPSTTYVERQYEAQPAPSAPASPAPSTATQPPPEAQQTQAKKPDERVLATVGKGNEHFGSGRYTEARNAYKEAMAIDPADGVPKLLYGLASFAEGDFVAATEAMRSAVDTTPDLIWYPFNVKALYRNDTKFQEHVAVLARFVDAQPGNKDAQFLLGYLWYASGDALSAKTIFGSLATNNPSEQLYLALRDAATQALDSMTKKPGQQPVQNAPPPQQNQ